MPGSIQIPHDPPEHPAQSGQLYQFHFTGLPRLETHRRTRRDVQAHAAAVATVKEQGVVGFEKVICEPTWIGRSPRLDTLRLKVRRPTFSSPDLTRIQCDIRLESLRLTQGFKVNGGRAVRPLGLWQ